jgi:hypothetical protein
MLDSTDSDGASLLIEELTGVSSPHACKLICMQTDDCMGFTSNISKCYIKKNRDKYNKVIYFHVPRCN